MYASMFAAPGIPIVLLIAALLITITLVLSIAHRGPSKDAHRPQQIIPGAGSLYDSEED